MPPPTKKRRGKAKKAARQRRQVQQQNDSTFLELHRYRENQDEFVRILTQTERGKAYDINHQHSQFSYSLLGIACFIGLPSVVHTILQCKNVDVNGYGIDEMRPLFLSCLKGHLQCVKLLCKHPGIDMNAISKIDGAGHVKAAFDVAVAAGYEDIVRFLLHEVSDGLVEYDSTFTSNHTGIEEHRKSPLYHSIIQGHPRITKLLLADPRINRSYFDIENSMNVMDFACYFGSITLIKRLEAKDFPAATDTEGSSFNGRIEEDGGALTERRALAEDYLLRDHSKICTYCQVEFKRKDLSRCSCCLEVWYCGKRCQKADWKRHKRECSKKVLLTEDDVKDYKNLNSQKTNPVSVERKRADGIIEVD